MDEKELIRRALTGDREARDLCTDKGIAIPCPLCGKEDCIEILDCYTAEGLESESENFRKDSFKCICNYLKGGCGTSIGVSKTNQEALYKWNSRPAPPVGRCKDCVFSRTPTKEDLKEFRGGIIEYKDVCMCAFLENPEPRWGDDFCSYFEPKEG